MRPSPLHELCHPGDGRGRGLAARHHLDDRDDVRRIRPVHADHTARRGVAGLELGDGNARGVRGDDTILGDQLVDLADHLGLELELLRHVLDDEIGALHGRGQIRMNCDLAGAPIFHAQRRQHAGRHLDGLRRLGALLGREIERGHGYAGARQHRRDAGPHGPQADERYLGGH